MGITDYVGKIFDGRYAIVELLGRGGMGSVYLARHSVIGKKVAVKILHSEFSSEEELVRRFYREAQTAASIAHANIIDILDVGATPQGEPYLVMEYLEGESLAEMLKRTGPIELGAALAILEPTMSALAAAHEKGIVHRDLKPENIFLVIGEERAPTIKLIDFGISKLMRADDSAQITESGTILGTPAYMPPEQIQGLSIDHRVDIYAAGVIFYEMLTGKLPFHDKNYNQLVLSILSEPPMPAKEAYPDVPVEALPLLGQLLAKDRNRRPSSALECLEKLRHLRGFENRASQLSHYTVRITEKRFAAGDLGKALSSSPGRPMASAVLSNMVEKATPAGWANTDANMLGRTRRFSVLLVVLSAMVLAVIVNIYLMVRDQGRDRASIKKSSRADASKAFEVLPDKDRASSEVAESVNIDVVGVPEGGVIYLDNAKVPSKRIVISPGTRMVRLRVSAPGHEDFETWIVPDRSQIVTVSFVPKSHGAFENTQLNDEIDEVKTRNRPLKRRASKRIKSRLQRIGRDIKYTEEFED